MNPILYLFYQFLKILVKTIFKIFFSKTTIIHPERLRFDHPAILVSNHPNTLLDPLNVACRTKKMVFFLANAGLFKHPIMGRLLNTLYCIPIERPQDVNGRRINNQDNFARCDAFLAGGGCLFIAPEGTSVPERRIRRIKTGTARIALSAERQHDFSLDLAIVPVGLTYTAPANFRSRVTLNVGEPLRLADYKAAYQADTFKTAKAITRDLQSRLESLVLHTEDDATEQLLRRLEEVLATEAPLEDAAILQRAQSILADLRTLDPTEKEALQQEAEHYFSALEKQGTNDAAVYKSSVNILEILLGVPFFLYGWINNWLAFGIPGWIAKRLNLFVGYDSTVKTLAGLFTVPIFYGLQSWGVTKISGEALWGWIYLASLLPMGWLAWRYRGRWRQWRAQQRFSQMAAAQQKALKQQRQSLSQRIQQIAQKTVS